MSVNNFIFEISFWIDIYSYMLPNIFLCIVIGKNEYVMNLLQKTQGTEKCYERYLNENYIYIYKILYL